MLRRDGEIETARRNERHDAVGFARRREVVTDGEAYVGEHPIAKLDAHRRAARVRRRLRDETIFDGGVERTTDAALRTQLRDVRERRRRKQTVAPVAAKFHGDATEQLSPLLRLPVTIGRKHIAALNRQALRADALLHERTMSVTEQESFAIRFDGAQRKRRRAD